MMKTTIAMILGNGPTHNALGFLLAAFTTEFAAYANRWRRPLTPAEPATRS